MLLKNRSYSEKSNWAVLLTTLGVLFYYLNRVPHLGAYFESNPNEIGYLLLKTIIVTIVLTIIYHSFIFGISGQDNALEQDERDILIRQKAINWAYWVMNAGLIYLFVQLFINTWIRTQAVSFDLNAGLFIAYPPIDFMIHGIVILGFVCEITQNLGEIFLQRRGV